MNCSVSKSLVAMSLGLLSFAGLSHANAQTVAYYRFEDGLDLQTATSPVTDSTGLHPLTVEGGSNARYRAFVEGATVPQIGQANTKSMQFGSLASLRSNDAAFNTFGYPAWTLEASVYFNQLTGFQTFVGKDGIGSGNDLADLYFQRNGRNGAFSILYRGVDQSLQGFDGIFRPVANHWYDVAAVYDGVNISLYVDGVLDNRTAITSPFVVRNTSWTIGRGYFFGPADPVLGFVDEVRFSSAALSTSQFLRTPVPEPGTIAFLLSLSLSGAGYLRHRRRK